jgi:outer membrane protein TolC
MGTTATTGTPAAPAATASSGSYTAISASPSAGTFASIGSDARAVRAKGGLAGSGEPLSYDEAMRLAEEKDPDFLAAKLQRNSAEEGIVLARSQLLPNVSLSLFRSRASQDATSLNAQGNEVVTTQQFGSSNQTVQLRQTIFRRREWLQLEQARVNVTVAEATLQQQLRGLRQRLNAAMLEVRTAELQIEQLEKQHALLLRENQGLQKRFDAGFVSALERDSGLLRLEQSELQRQQLAENLELSRMRLGAILGAANADRPLELPPNELLIKAAGMGSLQERMDRALERNPDIRALRAQIESARLEIAKSDAGHWPTVDAVASYTDSGSEFALNRGYSYKTSSLGVQVAIPVYSGGAVQSSSRQAKLSLGRLEALLESTLRRVRVEVESGYRREQQVLRSIQLQEAQLALAKTELRAAEQRLGVGFISESDLEAAKVKVFSTERSLQSLSLQLLSAYTRTKQGY